MFQHVNASVGIRHVEKLCSLFLGAGVRALGDEAGKSLVTWVNATPTEHSATLEHDYIPEESDCVVIHLIANI